MQSKEKPLTLLQAKKTYRIPLNPSSPFSLPKSQHFLLAKLAHSDHEFTSKNPHLVSSMTSERASCTDLLGPWLVKKSTIFAYQDSWDFTKNYCLWWIKGRKGSLNYSNYMKNSYSCWLVVGSPLWKIWLRQLGWWHYPILMGQCQKWQPNHQPG